MTTRRLAVNLVTFLVLSLVAVGWAATTLFSTGENETMEVTAVFAEAPGLAPATPVTYLGQSVGRVEDLRLSPEAVEVGLSVRATLEAPAQVTATIRRRSAVGEPYLDLAPVDGLEPSTTRLADGDVIPPERTARPLAYSQLFDATADLFAAVEPDALQRVLAELGTALDGRGPAIRQLLQDGGRTAATLGDGADVIDEAVTEVGALAATLAEHAGGLEDSIQGLHSIGTSMVQLEDDYAALMTREDGLLALTSDLLADTRPDLGCTLESLAVVADALGSPATQDELDTALRVSPRLREIVAATQRQSDGGTRLEGLLVLGVEPEDTAADRANPVPPDRSTCASTTSRAEAADDAPLRRSGREADPSRPGAGATVPGGQDDPGQPGTARSTDEPMSPDRLPLVPVLVGLAALGALAALRPWRWIAGRGQGDGE